MTNIMDRLLNEGMEKGIEKGMEKGMEKGLLRGQFETLIKLVNQNIITVKQAAEQLGMSVAKFKSTAKKLALTI